MCLLVISVLIREKQESCGENWINKGDFLVREGKHNLLGWPNQISVGTIVTGTIVTGTIVTAV